MSFTASLSLSKHESKPTITNNINVYPTGGIKSNGVVHAKMPTSTKPVMMRSMSQRPLPATTEMASAPPVEQSPSIPTTLENHDDEKLEDYPPAPTPVAYQDASTQTEEPIEEEPVTTQRIQLFEKSLLQILVKMFGSDKTLLKHMLEPIDKIILKHNNFMALISILTGSENIHMEMEPMIKGCCTSSAHKDVIPVRITKILVNGVDFFINYNELYNMFTKYNIYTDRCFLVEEETIMTA